MSEQTDIRVLHVDDDSAVRELTAEMLIREDERLDVETASSASEGLNYLSSHGVDCLVSDYEMPGQNGIEFLEAVRAEHPDLPFILYTGKGSETVASDAISAGVTDYLEKSGGTEQYELLANRVCNAVEQYRSTREAERTRRRLQNLAESTSHCVWMFDRDWEELLFISGYEDIWDRPVERIRDDPRDFLNGVHPEDREFVRDAMERMSSGEPIDIEYRILQGDGESRWVWVQGEPVVDGHGTVKSVVGFTRDVTERKEREQELRRTSARLEALFESSPDMINVHDTDGNLLEPNPRLCEATGYDAAELTDMKVWDLDRTMDSDEARALWEGMAVGDSRRVEGTYRRRDGSTFPVEVHIRRLRFEAEDRFIAIARDISERKEREAEPGRHERIVQNLPVGVFRTTPDGEFVEVNQAYVSLIDAASRSDVTDTEAADLWADADDRERLLGQLEQDGVVEGREVEIETLEGESRWVETTLRIVDEDDGEYLDGVVKDVTERRERQRELRRAERRFEAVFEDPNIMLVLADTDGAVRDLNGTATEYLDAGGSAVGDPLWELPWWDERAKPVVRRKIERAADGDYVGGRADITGPDGEQRRAGVGIRPVTDDGEVVSLVVTVREVSLQRERERKLRRYRRVVETMDDIAFVVDEEWNVEFTTESVLDYVDVSLDALEDQPVMDLARKFIVEDDGPTRFEQALDRAFDGTHPSESPERVELTLDANGERVTFEYQFSPLVVEGETEAVIVTMRDITERRNREQDLRRQNEQRDEFASVVSHDLQNPLRVAEGHLELARGDCESEHLDAVAQAHDRMDTLIDDLLTLARGKKAIIDTKPVDLMETVEACWANVETADVSLAIEDSRTIDADENCLRQVFENLIRNAVEHGGENVIVGALSDGFYVEDDGPGIPTDERDDVFDAGYSTSEEGTGFGLRIVKEIVEAHGWEVHIADGSEGGARVEVTDVEFASE